jgi:hypothetical protein
LADNSADLDHYLDEVAASEHLKERGLDIAAATLKKWRCVGGGPKFQKYGRPALAG